METERECEYRFIYNTVRAYKRFEDDLKRELSEEKDDDDDIENERMKGYLIDKKYLNYWKKFTDYDSIKNKIYKKNYNNARSIIKQYRDNNYIKDYQSDASQKDYYSPFAFYKDIKMKGKQYFLVDENFWKLICFDNLMNEEGKTNYYIDKNKIIFSFGQRGKVEMETEDNILRDSKEMILRDVDNFEEQIREDDEEAHILEMKKLILLYAYEQDLKNKINNLKYSDNHFKDYYLISKEWMEQYKQYYHFDELSKLINQNPKIRNVLNNGYEEAKKYIEYVLSKINLTRKKPKDTFPEILKNENTFLSEGGNININNRDITFWKNFEIVNEELKDLLRTSEINQYDIERVSSAKGLITGGKIILDLSNDQNNEGNYALEIGTIRNNDMIFVDEYIFQYDNEVDKNNNLNFFKDKFYLFQKDELNFGINLKCNLISDNGDIYGTAFKIPPHE
jgi:hypothetical protein